MPRLTAAVVFLWISGIPVFAAPPASAPARNLSPRVRHRLDYFRQNALLAYDAAGMRDPKWDDGARETIAAYVRTWSKDPTADGDEPDVVIAGATRAAQAGCNDPMLRLAGAAVAGKYTAVDRDVLARMYGLAGARLNQQTNYPPLVKCFGYLRGAQYGYPLGVRKNYEKMKSECLNLAERGMNALAELARDEHVPPEVLIDAFEAAGDASIAIHGDRATLFDRAYGDLQKSSQPKALILAIEGHHLIHYAWDARGDGLANTVSRAQSNRFSERLASARNALEEAWKLDPTSPDVAEDMISLCMGESRPRPEMEQWFDAALKLDPDDAEACRRKMYFLEPKWCGSAEEMVGFGRQLLKGGNWNAGLPLLLAQAHWTLGQYMPNGGPAPDPAYFAANPANWADVDAVYRTYLTQHPGSRFHRTRYAVVAAWAGQQAVASKQFKILGAGYSRRAVPEKIYAALAGQPGEF